MQAEKRSCPHTGIQITKNWYNEIQEQENLGVKRIHLMS